MKIVLKDHHLLDDGHVKKREMKMMRAAKAKFSSLRTIKSTSLHQIIEMTSINVS